MFRAVVDAVTVDAFAHHDRAADRRPHGTRLRRARQRRRAVVDSIGTTDSAHVIIGLDLSGSVDGRTLEQLRDGVRALVGELTPHDRVSLFTFSDRLRLLMRASPARRRPRRHARRGSRPSGATPLHDAVVFGSALALADQRPSVFLLFTDGQDTASWTVGRAHPRRPASHQRRRLPGRRRPAGGGHVRTVLRDLHPPDVDGADRQATACGSCSRRPTSPAASSCASARAPACPRRSAASSRSTASAIS